MTLYVHNLVVCYSPNVFLRTSSDTAALFVSLSSLWQYGGAIENNEGATMNITGSEFIDNTAGVSHALCA